MWFISQLQIINSMPGISLAVLFEPGINQALVGWYRWGDAFLILVAIVKISNWHDNLNEPPRIFKWMESPPCFFSAFLWFSNNLLCVGGIDFNRMTEQLCELKPELKKHFGWFSQLRIRVVPHHPHGDKLSASMFNVGDARNVLKFVQLHRTPPTHTWITWGGGWRVLLGWQHQVRHAVGMFKRIW